MSLIKCKDCGNEVSKKAQSCPNCGAPLKRKSIGCFSGLLIIFLVIVGIGIIGLIIPQVSKRKVTEERRQTVLQQSKIKQEKENKERKDFLANIENHYNKAVSLHKDKKLALAAEEAELFGKHGMLDYKDMRSRYKQIMIAHLEEKVRPIPASRVDENLMIYNQLARLDPNNEKYKKKVAYYAKRDQEKKQRAASDLELLNWQWRSEHGWVYAEGQVKNISGRQLRSVQAVVTWYDRKGNFITSDSSFIEYNPILPGQSSPFKVMERYNPAMEKASLSFKYFAGGTIPTHHKK
jgi:hypothetical protein